MLKNSEDQKPATKKADKVAAVLIRSFHGMRQEIRDTLKLLNLTKKHSAVVLEANPITMGMLRKVENYVTFGEITEDTEKAINKIKGKEKSARLHPPRGGFERKGIKQHFKVGGALGRRDNMDKLVQKMIK